jgi:hypothetical protein
MTPRRRRTRRAQHGITATRWAWVAGVKGQSRRWDARLTTTAIYADAIGAEEKDIVRRIRGRRHTGDAVFWRRDAATGIT